MKEPQTGLEAAFTLYIPEVFLLNRRQQSLVCYSGQGLNESVSCKPRWPKRRLKISSSLSLKKKNGGTDETHQNPSRALSETEGAALKKVSVDLLGYGHAT